MPNIMLSQTITAVSISDDSLCTSDNPNINFTVDGTFTSGNTFSVELSDATGSFTSPSIIGTLTEENTYSMEAKSIAADLTSISSGSNLYRVRVVSSNPSITSADNGTDITITADSDTSYFGNNEWIGYFFDNNDFTDYRGYHTIPTESFNTTTYWGSGSNPSTASNYIGCSATNSDQFTTIYKRKGFTCGLYQLDIFVDDQIDVIIDGQSVYTQTGYTGSTATNVWEGILSEASEVEIRHTEGGGGARITFTLNSATQMADTSGSIITQPSTDTFYVCTGGTTYDLMLDATGTDFTWSSPSGTAELSSTSTATTTFTSPATADTITYIASARCVSPTYVIRDTVVIVTAPEAQTNIYNIIGDSVCSGGSGVVIQAKGANSYLWTPSADLSATIGSQVTATPSADTRYYVTGSIEGGCSSSIDSVDLDVFTAGSGSVGDTSVVGDNQWIAYFFDNNDFTDYRGYYTIPTESFNTTTYWSLFADPSAATNYIGCSSTNSDQFTTIYKRRGFTCGFYQLDIFVDDQIDVIIDGVLVYSQSGYTGLTVTNVWEGVLSEASEIEIRHGEGGGGARFTFTLNSASQTTDVGGNIITQPATDTFYVCTGGTTYDLMGDAAGNDFTWSSPSGTAELSSTSTSTTTFTAPATADTITYIASARCVSPTYVIRDTVVIVTAPEAQTEIYNVVGDSICAGGSGVVIQAKGANDYSWTPTTDLSSTTGFQVTATPSADTRYYVTGNIEGSCSSTIDSVDLDVFTAGSGSVGDTSVIGDNQWIAYFFDNNDFTDYRGYYTIPTESFNTTDYWSLLADPSAATNYFGCSSTNSDQFTTIYKRRGFTCGFYQLDIFVDDQIDVIIDGVLVYSQNGYTGSTATNVWEGVLAEASEIEIRHGEGGGGARITFTLNSATQMADASGNIITQPAADTFYVCTGGTTYDLMGDAAGSDFTWSSPSGTAELSSTSTSTTTFTAPATADTITYIASARCVSPTYVIRDTVVIVTAPEAQTEIYSVVGDSVCVGGSGVVIQAKGANDYSWTPTTDLNATTGYQVTATPSTDTRYYVTGSIEGSCSSTIDSVDLDVFTAGNGSVGDTSVIGDNQWIGYFFDNNDFTDYRGYYTIPTESFNTVDYWASNSDPSAATNYFGCSSTNSDQFTTVYKRRGFTCGFYQLDIFVDDQIDVLVDGVLVYSQSGYTGSTATNVWEGVLAEASEIEIRHGEGGGGARITFTLNSATQSSDAGGSIITQPATDTFYVCTGGTTYDLMGDASGTDFTWSSPSGTAELSSTSTSTTTFTAPATADTITYIASARCVSPTYVIRDTVIIITAPEAQTEIYNVLGDSVCIGGSGVIIQAKGANDYAWTPIADLNPITGPNVTATPGVDTRYYVTGSIEGSCSNTIDSVDLDAFTAGSGSVGDTSVTGINQWIGYFFDNNNFTDYRGYHTIPTESFNTVDYWASNSDPSAATNYFGCSSTNSDQFTTIYKRRGFTCGLYQLDIFVDDQINVLIDGQSVYTQTGYTGSTATNVWEGVLSSASEIEIRHTEGGGGARITFTLNVSPNSAISSVWDGDTDTDWNNTNNWCNNIIPNNTINAYIPNGMANYPVLDITGNQVNSLFINGGSMTMNTSSSLEVHGNWENNATFTANGGIVEFTSSNSVTISGSSESTFDSLLINKDNATDSITSSTNLYAKSNLNLTSGIIVMNSPTTLTLESSGDISNGSTNSFIDGPLRRIGSGAFTFPLGDSTIFYPMTATPQGTTNSTDTLTIQYINEPSPNSSNLQDTLDRVSLIEYWDIQYGTNADTNYSFTLNWNSGVSEITDMSTLVAAHYNPDSSEWINHGQGAMTGSFGSGSITTSVNVTTEGPITFGAISPYNVFNPLPVSLIYYNLSLVNDGQDVSLTWSTSAEIDNNYFVVERSDQAGYGYDSIGYVLGNGTSNDIHFYSFLDEDIQEGIWYYRLRQVDYNGNEEIHDPKSIVSSFRNNITEEISVFPVPFQDYLNINFVGGSDELVYSVKLIDSFGRVIIQTQTNSNEITLSNLDLLTDGIYYIQAETSDGTQTIKTIKGYSFE